MIYDSKDWNKFNTTLVRIKARIANKGLVIARFPTSQTHLCKVEVQFSERRLVLKSPAIAKPRNVSDHRKKTAPPRQIPNR